MTENSAHITAKMPLAPAIQAWESYLNDQGRSPNTVKAFLSDVRILTQYLPPDRTLGAITTEDLNNYFKWMEKERGIPCSPKTLARRITSIKSFFRWLHQFGALLVDPAEKVANRSVLAPLPVILTEKEKILVWDTANKHRSDEKADARYFCLLALLLTTGVKKGELLGIHLNHLELDAPEGAYLFVRYASPANRYKERKIPLTEEWIEAYREYIVQYEPIDQLFPWSPRRLEYLLEDLSNEAGITKHLSFKMCRWTSALTDYNLGMEQDRIRQKLGISKIQWREIKNKLRKLSREEE
ncbi:MAG: site-specific integrase [Anaerolineae bacterium]|jgi:site-specific recombinase XerD|nr:site-specific integrase [Anaerolineae bacterium]MBT7074281.1 site-specific integrase [Anaerolineae bacterium]MBT7781901.1 site-specific integrase [Anaerolineae bacterium]